MPEPGLIEQQPEAKHYTPDYKLTSQELNSEGRSLIAAFAGLINNDPDAQRAKAEQSSDESIGWRDLMFKKNKVIYKVPTVQFTEEWEKMQDKTFNLLRYDELGNEEDLTIVMDRVKPSIEYKLVYSGKNPAGFEISPEAQVSSETPVEGQEVPKEAAKPFIPKRDYFKGIGLTISGAREMLERTRKDFAKPIATQAA